jgi:hypothetical protein
MLSAINAGNTGTNRPHQAEISTAGRYTSAGRVSPPDSKTCCPVEHPGSNMHEARSLFLVQVTSKVSFAAALNNLMDIDHTTEPWMPWIKHFSGFGNMGLAVFTSTTMSDYTKPWVYRAPRQVFEEAVRLANLRAQEKNCLC